MAGTENAANGARLSRRAFLTGSGAALILAAGGGLALARQFGADDGPPAGPGTPEVTATVNGQSGLTTTPVPRVDQAADGYLAVAPRTFRAGQAETVSLALFKGDKPANSTVTVALLKDGKAVAQAADWVPGRGSVALTVPKLAAGDYQLKISGKGFSDTGAITVEDNAILFLETDKPIYKPGQTMRIRLLALDAALRPVSGDATVAALDAKGIKVFKKTVTADDFGMASFDLPLSDEPNLGVWKLSATMAGGKQTAQRDVRVEKYVLPKYDVTVTLPKEWALASETLTGTVSAEYSFGKPVKGEVEIVAQRYVGTWQEYARVTKPLDGSFSFELPAVRYVTGTPANGGGGGVRLDVTVREEATGYEEQNSTLVTIVASPVGVRVVPETASFKPGLPLALLVTTETPDHQPVDASVALAVNYQDAKYQTRTETRQVTTKNGAAMLKITPGKDVVTTLITPTVGNGTRGAGDYTGTPLTVRAAYSPSGAFIHVEQTSQGALKVGDTARFTVTATGATGSATVYYEVLGRGQVVFSDIARGNGGSGVTIAVPLTPALAPSARLLVYQILPNSEVAADWLPFKVAGTYPQTVTVKPEKDEVRPGDDLAINVQTEGAARVGLAAVDKAVFILAENRLNLQQVFDEIEQLYETPQAEIHDQQPVPQPLPNQGPVAPRQGGVVAPAPDVPMPGGSTINPGAKETFQGAGVMVLTNRRVPEGKQLQEAVQFAAGAAPAARSAAAPAQGNGKAANAPAASPAASAADTSQAEPARTRQFFPETWVWADLTTGADGKAAHKVTAPDSITTWNLRAVALSKEKGLGIGEAELRVFQPFFVSVDLPYSAIRGEEFPVKIAVYNYTNAAQQVTVELADADWFDLLDARQQQVTVEAQGVGSAAFTIRPTLLGARKLTVTAKGGAVADAIVKELLVEPEGVAREQVTNLTLTPGTPRTVALAAPAGAIAGSPRALVALTGNVLSQTIEGLDNLLQMPYGCGEQNMLLFAPDVFITRYLKETGQEKPEIAAKAEVLMLTGYQRELTYRRDDGSFSAFGQSDKVGSLWLTAFVLKTFAQAKDLIFIDDAVLAQARDWIRQGQKADGSFDPIGFIHHQDMLGGLRGKPALTAFVAIALREAGDDAGAAAAIRYLEGQLAGLDDAYSLAIGAYALALAQSKSAGAAHDRLLAIAHDSDDGLSWGDEPKPQPLATPAPARSMPQPYPAPNQSATIETTGYAALALLAGGDKVNAGRAVRWLASRRNAQGGFGSTQDTVVALQALTSAASSSRADLAATVTVSAGSWRKDVQFTPDNADVMQIVELPDGAGDVTLASQGKGQLMAQAVSRYNLPAVVDKTSAAFQIDVRYSADQIATNDLLTITAQVHYTPPEPLAAGMIVLDIAVPTGFAPETPSLDALAKRTAKIKRWDVAGRKVIFYLEDMQPDESLTLTFQARALYPVRAQATVSQVYAYYRPDWRGESLGARLIVT